jgi:hypothetical protein
MDMRRRLALITLIGLAVSLTFWGFRSPAAAAAAKSVRSGDWSDPATWGGRRPAGGNVIIGTGTRVRLDQPATRVAGVTIAAGATLVYDPNQSTTLESTANVVVEGRLEMRPASPAVIQTLRFIGVNEAAFKGGGMVPLATDTGLWVTGRGQLALVGSTKLAWTRAKQVLAGATRLSVDTSPRGWRQGDELAIAPTEAPTVGDVSWSGFDESAVRTVSGRSVTLVSPTARAHPEVAGKWRPEVLNLTRNVRIEGTPTGRTHVMITAASPQTIAYVQLRHVGPRQAAEEFTSIVRGRYGLHFHMMGDGSRGSRVTGTVVRDAGSFAFVPHRSNGITFRDTISYNTLESAYWWDDAPDNRTAGDESNDILYDRAVAANVRSDPDFRGYRLSGFNLMQGLRNEVRDSVAVGVQGNGEASGFQWPESSGSNGHGVWKFDKGNVAHNNKVNGIFAWQNDGQPHRISGFTAYHNSAFGIDHGAYQNGYRYDHSTLYGNGAGAIRSRASSWFDEGRGAWARLRFDNIVLDGAGISDYLIVSDDHVSQAAIENPTLVSNSILRGFRRAAVAMQPEEHNGPYAFDFVNTRIPATEFSLADGIPSVDNIRVQDDGAAYLVTTMGSGRGTPVRAWNARRSRIAPFHDEQLAAFSPGAPPLRSPSLPAQKTSTPRPAPAPTPMTTSGHHAHSLNAAGAQQAAGAGSPGNAAPLVLAGLGLLALGAGASAYWYRRSARRRPPDSTP